MKGTAVALILLSFSFGLAALLLLGTLGLASNLQWLFPELGPAVLQDSYLYRGPALESPFGIIGDIPGGYSMYAGSPLGVDNPSELAEWVYGPGTLSLGSHYPNLVAVLFASVPLVFMVVVVLLFGRRSYGASKTH